MAMRLDCQDPAKWGRALGAASAAAVRGDLVVAPTDSIYAITTAAFSTWGVERLRRVKSSGDTLVLQVLLASPEVATAISVGLTPHARLLMGEFWPGPLTLLVNPQPLLGWGVDTGAPMAIRMPAHPMFRELLNTVGPMVATATNLPGSQPTGVSAEALAGLDDRVALFLDCGDLPVTGLSTVVDVTGPQPRVCRIGVIEAAALREFCPDLVDDL